MSDPADDIASWDWRVTHTVEFSVERTWLRINNLADRYFEIAEAAFATYLHCKDNPIEEPPIDEDPREWLAFEESLLKSSIQTIVFAAMACETSIYDLAAIHLSDDYAKDVLDRLDVIGKWLVVPRLICGKSLDPHGPAINSLRTFIPIRNKLVHHKSSAGFDDPQNLEHTQQQITKARAQMASFVNAALPAFQGVVLLSLELNRVLGTTAGVLPTFERHIVTSSDVVRDPRISKVIQGCRETDGKARRKAAQVPAS
ncbi:hypothetical protein [Ralstonia wenshanensis]|uniref:hypothetical protein n=1 Tax=Ralstonia wenshanensis TaxID=2842456 RepID=UPI003D9882D6